MLKSVQLLNRPSVAIVRARNSSYSMEESVDTPVPRTPGRAQFWKNPIYTGPHVNPLHRGPDYSIVGGIRPLATSRAEADRLLKQVELSKKVVQLLGEIRLAEDLYEKECTEKNAKVEEKARWTPKQKAVQEIC